MKTPASFSSRHRVVLWPLLALLGIATPSSAETIRLYFDPATPQIGFAADDIKTALEKHKHTVETADLAALSKAGPGKKIVLAAATDKAVASLLSAEGGKPAPGLGEQAYAIRSTTKSGLSYRVQGGDAVGAMYGGLQIAENIQFKNMTEPFNEDDAPHLKSRGIKFNVPLDKEAPTYFYDSRGTANRLAIRHVWDITFDSKTKNSLPWKEEFNLTNQTTSDDGRTSWTATRSEGVFEVKENALFINDKGDEGTYSTGEIDVSRGPVDISLDITSQGGVDNGDYVKLYQIVDGAKETLIGEIKGKDKMPAMISGTASGKKLVLLIRSKVSSDDEVFMMDNVKVE